MLSPERKRQQSLKRAADEVAKQYKDKELPHHMINSYSRGPSRAKGYDKFSSPIAHRLSMR